MNVFRMTAGDILLYSPWKAVWIQAPRNSRLASRVVEAVGRRSRCVEQAVNRHNKSNGKMNLFVLILFELINPS